MDFDAFAESMQKRGLPAHQPHTERYGRDGATYWVARRLIGPVEA